MTRASATLSPGLSSSIACAAQETASQNLCRSIPFFRWKSSSRLPHFNWVFIRRLAWTLYWTAASLFSFVSNFAFLRRTTCCLLKKSPSPWQLLICRSPLTHLTAWMWRPRNSKSACSQLWEWILCSGFRLHEMHLQNRGLVVLVALRRGGTNGGCSQASELF